MTNIFGHWLLSGLSVWFWFNGPANDSNTLFYSQQTWWCVFRTFRVDCCVCLQPANRVIVRLTKFRFVFRFFFVVIFAQFGKAISSVLVANFSMNLSSNNQVIKTLHFACLLLATFANAIFANWLRRSLSTSHCFDWRKKTLHVNQPSDNFIFEMFYIHGNHDPAD